MDIQFAKYKELIEQQLEELTAEDVLGQSAQKTVELDQQSVGRLSRMDALQSDAMFQLFDSCNPWRIERTFYHVIACA